MPDTRHPSERWQAIPPGDGPPPPPRHAAPTGHAGQGDSVGPPHPHTRSQSTWVADPNSMPSGRAVGGGTAPDLRRPSQWWKAPPPGTPFPTASNAGPQGRTLWGRCWVPTPAPTAPGTHGSRTLAARSRGQAAGGGTAPDTRRPSQRWQATPPRGRPPAAPAARSLHRAYATDPPHGGRTARSQVGGNQDRTAPPQALQTEQETGAGHAEGHGPRGTALPAPSAGSARGAHATPPRGGGADAAGARAHTHTKGTRGQPEGQPDRTRGTHRPRGMAYQRARVRDTPTGQPATRSAGHAGREGGNRRNTTPGTGPSPPNRPRAPRTHRRGTASAKAVVAHCAMPQPLG